MLLLFDFNINYTRVPAVYSGFTGLAMAPISLIARYTIGYSRQLGLLMVTMSPGFRPIFTNPLAVFLTILDSSLNVYFLSVSASIWRKNRKIAVSGLKIAFFA